ncbi:MAG TPA: hypothetical protein VF625_16545 [Longimicrobium sp.]
MLTSTRQLRRAHGFVCGELGREGAMGWWTVTAWTDAAAMLDYRNTAAHGAAMPKLTRWCDEASIAHWEQEGGALPTWPEALDRMVAEGRLSKVRHPTPEHAAGRIAPARQVPSPGLPLSPLG